MFTLRDLLCKSEQNFECDEETSVPNPHRPPYLLQGLFRNATTKSVFLSARYEKKLKHLQYLVKRIVPKNYSCFVDRTKCF